MRGVFREKIYVSGLLIFCVASYEIAVYPEMCQSQALDFFLDIKNYNILGTNTLKINMSASLIAPGLACLYPRKKK